jgi:hypothetical protein
MSFAANFVTAILINVCSSYVLVPSVFNKASETGATIVLVQKIWLIFNAIINWPDTSLRLKVSLAAHKPFYKMAYLLLPPLKVGSRTAVVSLYHSTRFSEGDFYPFSCGQRCQVHALAYFSQSGARIGCSEEINSTYSL